MQAKRVTDSIWRLPTRVGRAFLVETDEGPVVFDTGLPGGGRRIVTALRGLGRKPEDVQRIVLSHHHADHVGGARELRKISGAQTVAHPSDADVICGDRPIPKLKRVGRLAFVAPVMDRFSRFAPCPIDVVLPPDVDDVSLGVADLRIIHTPGHTMGSISVLVPGRRTALLGDALFNYLGRTSLSWGIDTEDMDAARRTAKRIADLEFDVATFGHGPAMGREAAVRLRRLAASLA